jgi:hypothetical protein
VAIHAVGNDPPYGTEDEARRKFTESKQAQGKNGLGQFPGQPVLDNKMDILAGFRGQIAGGKQAKSR